MIKEYLDHMPDNERLVIKPQGEFALQQRMGLNTFIDLVTGTINILAHTARKEDFIEMFRLCPKNGHITVNTRLVIVTWQSRNQERTKEFPNTLDFSTVAAFLEGLQEALKGL